MLSILRKKCGIEINDIFFSHEPEKSLSSSPVCFFVQAARPLAGFYRFQTPIIDLRQQEGVLFSRISSGSRYKIRRAEREGIVPEFTRDPAGDAIHNFAEFFDEFAKHKNLSRCNRKKLLALHKLKALVVTRACLHTGRCVVMHAYIADRELSRLRLLYSASHFRGTDDSEERNLIGRANRFLHWAEIQRAKGEGFEVFDLGGLPLSQDDPAKNAIARFKSEFGGTPIVEYNGYTSRNPLIRHTIPTLQRLFA
jgi:hypothetical protein